MSDQRRSAPDELKEDAIALGRRCSETRYKNPNRTGCPGEVVLRAMAKQDRHLTLDDMPLDHVVTCSPCYTDYLRYRRTAVILSRAKWVAAAVLIVATALATSRLLLHRGWQQARNTEEQAPIQLQIDLQPYSPLRGEYNSPKKPAPIQLPARPLHVTFLLPLGSDAGDYTVRLQNPTGAVKLERQVKVELNRGIASILLDLRLQSGDEGPGWLLIIRDPDEILRTYPVAVGLRR